MWESSERVGCDDVLRVDGVLLVGNPMYVGAAAAILGAGLALSSPSVVLFTFVFVAAMHLFVVLHEEPALTHRFGDAYERYRSLVHRWRIRRPVSGAGRAVS